MNQPSVDELTKKIGSRYGLCTVCAKRARQIIDQAQSQGLTEFPGKEKPLTLAANEILSGRVSAVKD
ncbi:MAG: DNA-directed RNA polymerase subunit omega [Clostridia bacterium]|nr:DNA-directed RNA polymerase subunit omega [Clostridia bacterium]MBQ1943239.1 DNA-directed RNA polymerase subunit omega [Clostridia bacterium]MBQ5801498.1 DNA-directed RNA polymerase subunit omega [Clostridia bacterium]